MENFILDRERIDAFELTFRVEISIVFSSIINFPQFSCKYSWIDVIRAQLSLLSPSVRRLIWSDGL